MARMIPDSFDYSLTNSNGEERVYNSLQRHLDDSWLVCHSWRWLRHQSNIHGKKTQGEGDFVLFHRDYGIIVIEVKGGTIELKSDGKYYSNGRLIQDPEKQASDTKFDIVERLKEKHLNTKCWVSHCVWFPDINWNAPYPPNFNAKIIFDKSDLQNPIVSISKAFRLSSPISDDSVIDSIKNILFTPFRLVKDLLFRINDTIEEQIRLTRQQENIYYELGLNSVLGVKGRAGTGKTLLATHKAIEFKDAAKKVLYLCSGKGLAEFLKEKIGNNGIDVFTFHGYALYYLRKYYPHRIPIDFDGSKDFTYILNEFTSVADKNRDKYDVCIIDEAQDAIPQVFEGLRRAFINSGYFYYFYDPIQTAFSRRASIIDPFTQYGDFIYSLSRNMRNTVEVSQASLNILKMKYNPARDFSSLTGDPPEIILVGNNTCEVVKKKIFEITIIQQIPKSYISILTLATEGRSSYGQSIDDVQITTFRKFKGLDNRIVLLVDVSYNHMMDEVYARQLYMAMTRSRFALILFFDDSAIQMKNEFCKKYKISSPSADFLTKVIMENNYE